MSNFRNPCISIAFLVTAFAMIEIAQADIFGSGANSFEIEFVTIGNPGNAPDTTGAPNPAGSVAAGYRIGKFEIPEDSVIKANALGGLGITLDSRGLNKPATRVSWLEAARFVNWLNTSSGSSAAYKFDINGDFQLWTLGDAGFNPNNLFRNANAKYFLPSADEWYKAAYYDPSSGEYFDYATGSNSAPTAVASGTDPNTAVYAMNFAGPADVMFAGGLSPYGTMGQGGNVYETEESSFDLLNNSNLLDYSRGIRGGAYGTLATELMSTNRTSGFPVGSSFVRGFRVASVPEPSSLLICGLAGIGFLFRRRRERRLFPFASPKTTHGKYHRA